MSLWQHLNPYPVPRGDRGKGIPATTGQDMSVPAPAVFLWSFHLREAGVGARATVTSRRVRGPAFLDTVTIDYSTGNTGTTPTILGLGYSLNNIAEQSGGAAGIPAGVTWLHENDLQSDQAQTISAQPGVMPGVSTTNTGQTIYKIGRQVDQTEFFLVASILNQSANQGTINAVMRVLENVAPDLLAELILR